MKTRLVLKDEVVPLEVVGCIVRLSDADAGIIEVPVGCPAGSGRTMLGDGIRLVVDGEGKPLVPREVEEGPEGLLVTFFSPAVRDARICPFGADLLWEGREPRYLGRISCAAAPERELESASNRDGTVNTGPAPIEPAGGCFGVLVLAVLFVLVAAWAFAREAAAPSSPDFAAICDRTLGGAEGAVLVLSLPEGRLLHMHGARVARTPYGGTSIYKPSTANALLAEGKITTEETVLSTKTVTVERYGVTLAFNYDAEGKRMNLSKALAHSNNAYFYLMGARLDPERLLVRYGELGLGQVVRLPETPEEKAVLP